jgi:thiamine biosynthesis lipoprotein
VEPLPRRQRDRIAERRRRRAHRRLGRHLLLVERAQEAWRLTGGSFDPTLLHQLRAAGYDRSFEQLATPHPAVPAELLHRRALVVDIEICGRLVTFPRHLGFDAGGIGKGLAADLVSALLLDAGADGCCVNLGGDLRVRGRSPGDRGWTIGIEHPAATRPVATIGLHDGAVATSTVLRRCWTVDGAARHHVIDPTTGEPTTSDVALASVVTGEAWRAEVLATAALLRGTSRCFDLLDGSSAGLVVDHNGSVRTSERFAAFTGAAPARRDVWAA